MMQLFVLVQLLMLQLMILLDQMHRIFARQGSLKEVDEHCVKRESSQICSSDYNDFLLSIDTNTKKI